MNESVKVRAYFQVTAVKRSVNMDGTVADAEEVEMMPVYGNDHENKEWSKFTPSGKLNMYITAEGAIGIFLPGQRWYLDFTRE